MSCAMAAMGRLTLFRGPNRMATSYWEATCRKETGNVDSNPLHTRSYTAQASFKGVDGKLYPVGSDPSTYGHETESIVSRTRALCPRELRDGRCEVLAVFSGARPSREGGARVERDGLPTWGPDCVLVHNYGAGGTGFQAGYGMALDAVSTVDDVLAAVGKDDEPMQNVV